MRRLRRGCVASVFGFAALAAQAQWQLPPGTSSSNEDAARSAPAGSAAVIAQAERSMEAQDWKTAITTLRPLVAKEPANAHAQYDLGFALDASGDNTGAAAAYRAAAGADTQLVSARVSLGLLLARTGQTAEASRWLREAVALPASAQTDPARAQAYRALAQLDKKAEPARARDELLSAVQLTGERPDDIRLTGEIAESLRDDAAAEEAYARAWKQEPGDAAVAAAYARVLTREGKLAEAQRVLDPATASHPGSEAVLAERVNLLLQQQHFAEAAALLESAKANGRLDAASSRLLARTYVAAGTPDKAEPLLSALVQASPRDGELWAEWGDSLIRQKRSVEAQPILEQALTMNFPSEAARARAAGELAFAASANGHPELVLRAIDIRDNSLNLDAPTAFLLATAHDTLHHTAKAVESYREFIRLAGQAYPDEVWQAQQRMQVLRRAK